MSNQYSKPSVTVDAIIFTFCQEQIKVLLVKRKNDPFKGKWAVPGGFVEEDEPLEKAVLRELEEETGLRNITLEEFHCFSKPGRDPRGRTITITYITFLSKSPGEVKGADDADDADWFAIDQLPEMAFDHKEIMARAIMDLKTRLEESVRAVSYFNGELKVADLRQALSMVEQTIKRA